MAFITTGLTNGGITTHYAFSYDDALQKTSTNPAGLEPDRTNALIGFAESDYTLMSGWFDGVALPFTLPISVQVANASGGAGWGPPLTLKPGSNDVNYCRYLMVSEVTEMLMDSQNKGWFAPDHSNEQSCGEGLSRFLAQQFLTLEGLGTSEPGYAISPSWLNSSLPTTNPSSTQVIGTTNYGSRADFVNNTLEYDHGIDPATGCAMLFLYWLQVQRSHSLHAIVAAAPGPSLASSCLRGVYKNLTGDLQRDPFPSFKASLALNYPEDQVSSIAGANPDNPWPIWPTQFSVANPASVAGTSSFAVLNRTPQQEELFWNSTSGDISSNWRNDGADNGAWHAQFAIAGANTVRADSPVAALARFPQQEDVFWIGADGDVSSNWRNDNIDSGNWHAQFALANPGSARAGSPLAALARIPQQLEAFWIGTDGDVSSNWRNDNTDGGAWHTQFAIANPGSVRAGSPLAVLARTPQQEEVFWIGAVGDVSSNWRNDTVDNGAWHSQFAIAHPGSVRADSGLAVIARTPSREDVFWVGTEGAVWNAWRDDGIDGGSWHPPLRINGPNSVRAASPLAATARVSDILEVFWIGADGDMSSTFLA